MIERYNNCSDELFQIKASESTNVEELFSEASYKTLSKWMKTPVRSSFNGEVVFHDF
jgi:hypothetical protein